MFVDEISLVVKEAEGMEVTRDTMQSINNENSENDVLGLNPKIKLPPWVSLVGQGVVDGVGVVSLGVGNTSSKVGESVGK